VVERITVGLADQFGRYVRMIEPLGHPVHDGGFESVVMEHGGIDKSREFRLAPYDLLGFAADARRDRIDLSGDPRGFGPFAGHRRSSRTRFLPTALSLAQMRRQARIKGQRRVKPMA